MTTKAQPGWAERSVLGFNSYSLLTLAAILVLYRTFFGSWFGLIFDEDLNDGLLWSIWAVMTVLSCWRVRPLMDLKLSLFGALGGLVIETWGTRTEIWWYFTRERPPLFIIPAWMIATVVVNRVAEAALPYFKGLGRFSRAYWVLIYSFVALMVGFVWPYAGEITTMGVIVIMFVFPLMYPKPKDDIVLFGVGVAAGIFFEYWGTSRECWTYYTRQVPPPVAVLAHGFAAIAFVHALRTFDALVLRLKTVRSRA